MISQYLKIAKVRTAFLLFFLSFFMSSNALFAQKSSEGTDFWFGFMDNYYGEAKYLVMVSSKTDANCEISLPAYGWFVNFSVSANSSTEIEVPYDFALIGGFSVALDKGIHLTSDVPVNCYIMNIHLHSTDGTVVLPFASLGTNYIISDYSPIDNAEFLVVATEDSTMLTINPTANLLGGEPAGSEIYITLNRGQIYQVKSKSSLSGTLVSSLDNKKIAVFSGDQCAFIPRDVWACDHIVEQMFPTEAWGSSFVTVPIATKTGGDIYRFVTKDDNTEIRINGVVMANLMARKFIDTIVQGPAKITSSKPICVTLFCTGTDYDSVLSDPFMVIIHPVRQKRKDLTFFALKNETITQSYVNVVTYTESVGLLQLNGNDISTYFNSVPADPMYSYAQIPVDSGVNRLFSTANTGFFAYLYGLGDADSYGYVPGVYSYPFDIEVDTVPCGALERHFHVFSDSGEIASYLWDFGDGTTSTEAAPAHTYAIAQDYAVSLHIVFNTGDTDSDSLVLQFPGVDAKFAAIGSPCENKQIDCTDRSIVTADSIALVEWDFGDNSSATGSHALHTYLLPGSYWIKQRVTTQLGCVDTSSQIITIRSLPQITEIHGPTRVFTGEVYEYSVPTPTNCENVWQVSGGFILRTTDSSAFIRWDFASGGVVKVTQINKESLCTKSLELGVGIAQWPNPFAGQMGDLFACEHSTETYFTITNDKFHYDWTIEGGVLHQINYRFIEVLWGEPGIGKIIVKMTDTATNSIHIDTVLVTIFPKPQAVIHGPESVCEGDDATYWTDDTDLECWWAVEKGSILSQTNDSCRVIWPATDTGLVTLIVRNRVSHCIDTAWLRVVIHPIPPRPTISRSGDTLSSSAEYGNHWFRRGKFMGDTTRVITPTLQDSISVRVISDFGCQSEMSDMIYFYNEAESEPLASSASIYPNPVEDELFVRINSTDGGRISIVDMLGTEVANVSFGPSDGSPTRSIRIGTQGIASGVYFLRLEIGGRTQHLRFTKQ